MSCNLLAEERKKNNEIDDPEAKCLPGGRWIVGRRRDAQTVGSDSYTQAETGDYLIPFDRTSQFELVQRLQFLPTNIWPAFLSPLKVQLSQFEATLANSPPPG